MKYYSFLAACCSLLLLASAGRIYGQLKGTHMLGDMGLQSGTQTAPSFVPAVAFYNYHTSSFVNASGDKTDAPSINMSVLGVGGSVVTNVKILGGNYGFSALIGFASSKIEGNLVSTKSSLAFTDTYIQPVQLGWKTAHADYTFGYAMYLPTGKYEAGGDDNAGLGIFTNEFSAGSTVYFDKEKKWNFSALFSYALNSSKKNTKDNDISPGNVLSIEGGLGKTWYKPVKNSQLPLIINAGLIYYIQYKVSQDQMTIPQLSGETFNLANKDHIYALGAEGNIFIPTLKSSIGLRWLGEMDARNRTQGNTFFVTLAPYISFFHPKKP